VDFKVKKLGRLISPAWSILGMIGYFYLHTSHLRGYPPYAATALLWRWFSYGLLVAIVGGIPVGLVFVALRRYLSLWERISCLADVFIAWGLMTLSCIASDIYAEPVLTPIGLGSLGWILLVVGLLWSIVGFKRFGDIVDSKAKPSVTNTRLRPEKWGSTKIAALDKHMQAPDGSQQSVSQPESS